jgi:hypothetical protein
MVGSYDLFFLAPVGPASSKACSRAVRKLQRLQTRSLMGVLHDPLLVTVVVVEV